MSWQPLVRSTAVRQGVEVDIKGEELWCNDQYVVHLRRMSSTTEGQPEAIHLSIRNDDRSARHDWRDFQRIKNQLAGPEWEAVEIYPAESRLVDTANQYHLWCFQFTLGIGWNERLVANAAQSAHASPGSVQRDPEPVDLAHGGLSKLKDILKDQGDDGYGQPKEGA